MGDGDISIADDAVDPAVVPAGVGVATEARRAERHAARERERERTQGNLLGPGAAGGGGGVMRGGPYVPAGFPHTSAAAVAASGSGRLADGGHGDVRAEASASRERVPLPPPVLPAASPTAAQNRLRAMRHRLVNQDGQQIDTNYLTFATANTRTARSEFTPVASSPGEFSFPCR